MSSNKACRLILCCAIVTLCTSCEYDGEYDALSSFPNNGKQLDIREMDLVEVRRSTRNGESEISENVETKDTFKENSKIEIADGVIAWTLRQPRESAFSNGSFTPLTSIDTGLIEDPYLEFNENNAEILRSPFTAAGVAVGDLNDDGLADVFIANQYRGGRLFRNQGNMRFVDVTASVGLSIDSMWGTSATLVDINNDGLLDIYICGYDSPNRLYINRGRKFSEQADRYGLAFKGACVGASFADYDRDGDLDAYLITNRLPPQASIGQLPVDREPGKPPRIKEKYREISHLIPYVDGGYLPVDSGQYDYLLRNDGYEFTDVTEECLTVKQPYRGVSSLWCDINNDQWPDLYVTNDHKDPDQLLQNLGPDKDGVVTFKDVTEEAFAKTTWFAQGVDLGDLNNDGQLDLLVAGNLASAHADRLSSQGMLFGLKSDRWFLNWGKTTQRMGNSISLNIGNNQFVDIGNLTGLAATDWTNSIRTGDFDNDGRQDIFFANGSTRPFADNDLNRARRAAIANKSVRTSDEFWLSKDLAPAANFIFRNNGDMQFESVGESWGIDKEGITQVAAVADLDGDGDLDVLTTGYKDGIGVYRNDINNENVVSFQLGGVQSNTHCIGAEIRLTVDDDSAPQVRRMMTSRGFMASESPVAQFGVGDAENIKLVEISWPNGEKQKLQNLKPNLMYRIQEPETQRKTFRKGIQLDLARKMFLQEPEKFGGDAGELAYGDFEKQPLKRFKHSQQGPCLVWADIDGDQDYDLFVGGPLYESARIFVNQGRGKFKSIRRDTFDDDAAAEDIGALFFDYDEDGDNDLYVVSGGIETKAGSKTMQDRLYRNDGKGNFARVPTALPDLTFSGGPVAAGDFDGDQRIDLFVGGRVVPGEYPTNPRSALLRNAGNKFEDVTEEFADGLQNIGMVTSCNWSDIDSDGKQDLMLTTELGPVHCFLNRGDRLENVTEAAGLGGRTGFYNSIVAGDVDNDGDTDFVVGNLGTNSPLSINESNPRAFYSAKFGERKTSTVVEAVARDGDEFVAHSLDAMLEALPLLKDMFKSNTELLSTPISKIFKPAVLSEALRLEVNSLESGVLFNDSELGAPKFRFEPLPDLAQISSIAGMQLADFDGDGNLDLLALQNNSHVNEVTEAIDNGNGALLIGKGDGSFEVKMQGSGVSIPGNGAALTTMDINDDGKADLIASINGESIQTYSNQASFSPIAIDLLKLRKKKNYIGAKVIIKFENGDQQLHEIGSTNGYLSQPPPIVFTSLNSGNEIDEIEIQWPDGGKISGTIRDLFNK